MIKEPELRIPSPPWKSHLLERLGEFDEEERRNVRTIATDHSTYEIQHSRNGEFCSSNKTLPVTTNTLPFSASFGDIPTSVVPIICAFHTLLPSAAYRGVSVPKLLPYIKSSDGTTSDDDMHHGGSSYVPPSQ